MKTETFITADYQEIDELVHKHYNNKSYKFAVIQESGNDSTHKFNIDGKIDKNDLEDANEIRNGKIPLYSNWLVLNCLCADGYLEKGKYLITVSW